MWIAQYSELYISKDDEDPVEVDLRISRDNFSIKFTLEFERFICFIKDGFMYYDDGVYDVTIDEKNDKVCIGIYKDPKIGYLIYNYDGGKMLYQRLKDIHEKKDCIECSKRLIF